MNSQILSEASTSYFVQTSRWKLHYNEAGSGPVVLLLHGTGPGATGWSNFSQNFAALSQHFRVIAPDFPGWGQSDVFDCSGESRNDANAEAIRLLLDGLGIERAALVGNSMGGAATLQFLADYPERVTHAITMGAGVFGLPEVFTPGGMSPGIKVIVDTYLDPSPANFRRLVEVMVYDPRFATDELAAERSAAALARREHLANWLKWSVRHPDGVFGGTQDLLTKLSAVKTPALMIHGRDDRTIALETSLRTFGLLRNSRALILNRCGHWAQLEHQAEFDRVVTDFILNADA